MSCSRRQGAEQPLRELLFTASKVLLDRIVTCSTVIFSTDVLLLAIGIPFIAWFVREQMRSLFLGANRAPGTKAPEPCRHFASEASSITAATSFAWTTREAWLPATSFVWACILAANSFWTSGASNLSFVLITKNVGLSRQAAVSTAASYATWFSGSWELARDFGDLRGKVRRDRRRKHFGIDVEVALCVRMNRRGTFGCRTAGG